jgi:ribonuclease-3
LAQRLGHDFANVQLLRLALVHRSAFAEEQLAESNERLEFLGDSVLGLVITDALYRRRSEQAEGRLARARAELVDETTLAEAARRIDVGSALRLGRGEDTSGGRDKASILADATEALIGAVYLDGGFEAARRVVTGLLEPVFDQRLGLADPKSHLQELAARGLSEPRCHRILRPRPQAVQYYVEVSDRRFARHGHRNDSQNSSGGSLGALETPE